MRWAGAAREYKDTLAQRPTPKPEESLGTGHGARESSYAVTPTFSNARARVPTKSIRSGMTVIASRCRARRDPFNTTPGIAVEPQPFPEWRIRAGSGGLNRNSG